MEGCLFVEETGLPGFFADFNPPGDPGSMEHGSALEGSHVVELGSPAKVSTRFTTIMSFHVFPGLAGHAVENRVFDTGFDLLIGQQGLHPAPASRLYIFMPMPVSAFILAIMSSVST